jgi:hypothetical protein
VVAGVVVVLDAVVVVVLDAAVVVDVVGVVAPLPAVPEIVLPVDAAGIEVVEVAGEGDTIAAAVVDVVDEDAAEDAGSLVAGVAASLGP